MRKIYFLTTLFVFTISVSIFSSNKSEKNKEQINIKTSSRYSNNTSVSHPPPTVDFNFTNNLCSGETVSFTSIVTGDGGFDYTWNFGDGVTSTEQNPNHPFEETGCGTRDFSVTLTVTDVNGLSASNTKTVSIKEKPDISFFDINPGVAGAFNNCGNTSASSEYLVEVGNNSSSNSCIDSYDIDWGDGNTQNSVTFPLSHNYSGFGTYPMKVTANGSNGCTNEVTYLVKNATNPSGGISGPGNTQNLCAPTASLQFEITNWGTNTSDTTYDIDFDDGTTISYTQADLVASSFYNASDPSASLPFPITPHSYTTSNCPNEFTVRLWIRNACAPNPNPATLPNILILISPNASFTAPSSECQNTPVLFINTTDPGFGFNCSSDMTFTWDFGDGTTPTVVNSYQNVNHAFTNPGTYTVTLTADNNICEKTTYTQNICIEPPLAPTFSTNTDNGCSTLNVNVTNTTDETDSCSPPTYLWQVSYAPNYCGTAPGVWNFTNGSNQNSKNPSFSFDTPGTYTLNLTASNSCGDFIASQDIIVKQPPTNIINPITDSCGSASITPVATVNSCSPASETPIYSWLFPGGTPTSANTLNPGTITYSSPGTYQVSFSVETSCGITTDTEDFTVNPIPTITNTNLTQTICSGTDTAEVILTSDITNTSYTWTATAPAGVTGFIASGNTSTIPVQTLFNTNTTSEDVTYTITPSVGNCDGTPVNLVVTVDPAPAFTSQPQSETICLNGPVATLSVTVNGPGTPSYQWYRNTANNTATGTAIPGATNATLTPPNNPVGVTYYYAIVSFTSGTGCNEIISDTARIEVVNGIQIDTHPVTSQSICNGGDIATPLLVTHSGGTGTISYQWYANTTNSNTGGTIITGATNANYTPPTFTITGNYYYYVVITPNGSGCSDITSDVAEVIVVNDPTITTQPLASQSLCQGTTPQNLEVVATGGLGSSYTYQWYSNTTNTNSGGTLITGATSSIFTPPTTAVGTLYYYCVITQTDPGCRVVSNTAEVDINAAPAFTSHPISEAICSGDTFNTLSVGYTNGVGTPTYQWYSNTINNATTGIAITGETNATYAPPSNSIGTIYYYAVITFSSGGCTEITSQVSEQTVNQTPEISAKTQTICSGITFDITPNTSGGDIVPANTLYTWTNPVISPTGAITGASNETNPQNNISQTLINTTTNPATVTYTVTPVSGTCSGADFTVTITVNPSISVVDNVTNSRCYLENSGAIDITISGGVPFTVGSPYLISWTGPNGYINANEDISNLEPGNYTLTIGDEGGCPFTKNYTITEPDALVFSTTTFNPETISCFGANDGSIGIDISGGTTPYQYNWTRNGTFFSNTEDISSLAPGDYEITVTDANNCTPITQSFQIIEPPLLEVGLVNQVDIICFGEATGEININTIGGRQIEVSTGVFDYAYAWTGPNGYTSNLQNLSGLFAGTYNLTVTDKSGCTDTLEVILSQTDEIIIDYTQTEIECYGDNNASIIINTISGGNPPYNIQWSNLGSGMTQNNLSAGSYIITITDSTNCVKQATVVIDEAPIFTTNPTVTQVSCFGENDANIVLNLVGGIDPVTLTWSDDPSAGLERNNIGPGSYTVTITDGTPCVITETFTIIQPDPLDLSAQVTDALDCDDANSGTINLIVTGGTLPLSYSWSNGATTEDLSSTPPGNYTVVVTDANDCEISSSWTINRFEPLTVKVDTITNFNCDTRTVNQTFHAKPSGGVPPYQLSWSDGIISGTNNEFMEPLANGLVILDIVDSFGCTTSYSVNVNTPVLGDANFELNSIGYSSYGIYSKKDPIQFTNIATGDYDSILWDFGDGSFSNEVNPVHTYAAEGDYIITQTVTYPFGCVYSHIITLTIEKGYSLMMPNAFTPNSDNLNDNFIPAHKALTNMKLEIYDTWGSLVFVESSDNLEGWNGNINESKAENGNYYYKFSGKTFYGETITSQGAIVLIR
ncbi:PKD domain-containing protein [Flavivirga eckloniae]|uniref:PKD domain-containing protein n=1 Tax=Flavivirga eckloniae TaxID=1803846 RepID=A0A2K9PWH6_9FLAO|nr:PKD domain-containing protein [Flavivirga eckloniae]AUP81416.1 hypothetical protein C1H87_22935 [Flavivirga eckloniae]